MSTFDITLLPLKNKVFILTTIFLSFLLFFPSNNIDNSYMVVEYFTETFQQFKQREDFIAKNEQTRKAMYSKMKQRKATRTKQAMSKFDKTTTKKIKKEIYK